MDTESGQLKPHEEICFSYPITIRAPKPEQEFESKTIAYVNTHPEVKPAKITLVENPPTLKVKHLRRKIKIGKLVRSTAKVGAVNEYEVTLQGINQGTAPLHDVIINDFIPKGFSLIGDTEEFPPVQKEEHHSIAEGNALKWVYETIEAGQKVTIKYRLRAEGDYDPKEVHRMLLG